MLHFHSIRWRNFLSTGTDFTEIVLDKSKTTLIAGNNGAGKSTFLDALSYALFKKPFRNINIPALVNTINQKDCLVEVEFSINSRRYMVRRGIKPAIFEIYSNGQLIPQPANVYDYQETLEKTIVRMNHKTFCQIVVLGSANFTPFMLLTPQNRREIIENLLDIGIFSKMQVILKQDQKRNEELLGDIENKKKLVQSKINLMEKHLRELETNNQELIKGIHADITRIDGDIQAISERKKSVQSKLEDTQLRIRNSSFELRSSIKKGKDALAGLDQRSTKIQEASDRFASGEACSTCKQVITEEALSSLRKTYADRIVKISNNREKIEGQLRSLEEKLQASIDLENEMDGLKKEASQIDSEAASKAQYKKSLETQLKGLQKAKKEIDTTDLDRHRNALSKLLSRGNEALDERELLSLAGTILKDDGIKATIIAQYIPVINTLINQYLAEMDFFCLFEIDETFKETMKAVYKDELNYSSLSQGERMRVDIALLFTWREIARMRNAAFTNILILDEIMDSSLDAAGTEEFLKIIEKISHSGNIFIISHKAEQIIEKFERVLTFKKVSNFSEVEGE